MDSTVTVLTCLVDEEKQNELWAIYDRVFKNLNLSSPCRQSLNHDEFIAVLLDDRITKFVLIDGAGKYAGLSLLTNSLEVIPWLSLPYFENQFPVQFQLKTIFYFMGTAVNEEQQLRRGGIRIFNAVGETLPEDCIVGYDYTENSEKAMDRLGNMIAHKLQGGGKILDKQVYWFGKRGGF